IADTAVTDAVAVYRDALNDGGGARLLLHLVFVIAVAEHVLFEETVGAGGRVASVDADRAIRPIALQADLSPRLDIFLRAGTARFREDRVDLRDAQALERVVLVDEHRERVDGDTDRRRFVTELLLEVVELGALHRARHRSELRGAGDQRRRRRARALAFDLDPHARVAL